MVFFKKAFTLTAFILAFPTVVNVVQLTKRKRISRNTHELEFQSLKIRKKQVSGLNDQNGCAQRMLVKDKLADVLSRRSETHAVWIAIERILQMRTRFRVRP